MILIARFANYLKQKGYAENTAKSYISDVKIFLNEIGDVEVIDLEKFSKAAKEKLENLYSRTTYSATSLMRKKFSWGIFCDFLDMPFLKIDKKIKVTRTYQRDIFKEADIQKILTYLENRCTTSSTFTTQRKILLQQLAILLGAKAGLRVGEYQNLSFSDVLRNCEVVIRNGKHGDNRRVPVPKVIQDKVYELKKLYEDFKIAYDDRVFRNIGGTFIHVRTFQRWLKNLAAKVDVPETLAKTHGLRHRFAKNFLDKNINKLAELGDILGHKNLDTTLIYLKKTQKELRELIENACFTRQAS